MLSRRALLKTAVVVTSGLAAGVAARDLQADGYTGSPVFERIRLRVPHLPKSFDGYRVGFLTDLHLGMWVPPEWITGALNVLSQHKVDLLLLGGDYIYVSDNPIWCMPGFTRNRSYWNLPKREQRGRAFIDASKLLSTFSPPDGTVAVLGNHEHWNSAELFFSAMRETPSIRILVNEEVSIRRGEHYLDILGVDDYLTGVPILPSTRRGERDHRFRILLSHNPDYVDGAMTLDASLFDLALCGHTHGGQICLPGLTNTVAPIKNEKFISGLTTVGSCHVYTSRGLGVVGLPFRFNCPPEITLIELLAS